MLRISLLRQRLHFRCTPQDVPCSHACCNVTPHAAIRPKQILHRFVVTVQTIHLMHVTCTRLSLMCLAVSQIDCKWHVLRFTSWLRASVSCGEIRSPPCLPCGGYLAKSTFRAVRDFVSMLIQHCVNCFGDYGPPVAKDSLATKPNRRLPSILLILML